MIYEYLPTRLLDVPGMTNNPSLLLQRSRDCETGSVATNKALFVDTVARNTAPSVDTVATNKHFLFVMLVQNSSSPPLLPHHVQTTPRRSRSPPCGVFIMSSHDL